MPSNHLPSHFSSQITPNSTAGEVALRLAALAFGTFGSVNETAQDVVDLADHLTGEAVRWINDRFEVGLDD